jgi:hypothetical protein
MPKKFTTRRNEPWVTSEKTRARWREKAKRQYAAKKELRIEQMRANRALVRQDVGRQMQLLFNSARARAKKDGREFTITKEWLALQPRYCAISGIPFIIIQDGRGPLTPSLDRIDSSKGYTPENTQIVACWYNLGKSDWNDTEIQDLIISYAEAIKKRRSVP